MKSTILNAAFTGIIALVSLNVLMYLQQPTMLFYPIGPLDTTPTKWGLEYEDVTFKTSDGIDLHGWYIPHHNSQRTLLFLHGNAGNISHRGDSVGVFHRLGFNVLIFDYRGYGQSQGRPSEAGLYRDAHAAWQYLSKERGVHRDNIVIFGRSLGGVMAANLAAEVQPRALVLESTFSSAQDFANYAFPILSRLVILRYELNTSRYITQVRSPVLVIHSPEDEIIPYHLGKKVYQAANSPKSFVDIKGDHNYGFLLSQPEYESTLGKYLQQVKIP